MNPTDLTIEVLKSIRDEVHETRTEDVLRAQHDVRPRLERAEHDITEIKHRLGM
jgi:hypothetical protein